MPKPATERPRWVEAANGRASARGSAAGPGTGQLNQFEQAYEAIEEQLVACKLQPGRVLSLQALQDRVGLGRTPVHQAVTRLAADTLIVVHARRGLQIAPIDLARERELLRLRREMERFVIRLATERSTASERNQMLHLKRHLMEHRNDLTIESFNILDRRIDCLFLSAAGEPFVESTLRPLHTIFRRIGWLYHSQTRGDTNLTRTVDVHLDLLHAVSHRHVEQALDASDRLIEFVDGMFDVLEREIAPAALDCSVREFGAADRSSLG